LGWFAGNGSERGTVMGRGPNLGSNGISGSCADIAVRPAEVAKNFELVQQALPACAWQLDDAVEKAARLTAAKRRKNAAHGVTVGEVGK